MSESSASIVLVVLSPGLDSRGGRAALVDFVLYSAIAVACVWAAAVQLVPQWLFCVVPVGWQLVVAAWFLWGCERVTATPGRLEVRRLLWNVPLWPKSVLGPEDLVSLRVGEPWRPSWFTTWAVAYLRRTGTIAAGNGERRFGSLLSVEDAALVVEAVANVIGELDQDAADTAGRTDFMWDEGS